MTYQIDVATNFLLQRKTAESLWNNKEGANHRKAAFQEIRSKLKKASPMGSHCCYCEENEGGDIEHILPKGHFPHKTFDWENYIWVCKECNTGQKNDEFYVFPPRENIPIACIRETEPASEDHSFIHPRLENPMDIMQMNISDADGIEPDFEFYTCDQVEFQSKDFYKVEKTLEILGLNERPGLKKSRARAFGEYKRLVKEYSAAKSADSFDALDLATTGNPRLDRNRPFEAEKARVIDGLLSSIKFNRHPTVWQEILRQRENLSPTFRKLLEANPELR